VVQSESGEEQGGVIVDSGAPVATVAPAIDLPAPSPTAEPTVLDPVPTVLVEDVPVVVDPDATIVVEGSKGGVIGSGKFGEKDIQPVVIEQAP